MPRAVDAEDRRREIAHAAIKLIAAKGFGGLTLRAVAAELDGSLTLVTHYYSSRAELLHDMADQLISEWDDDRRALEEGVDDPWERLSMFLEWLMPMDAEGELEERSRIILAAETRIQHPDIQVTLNTWDRAMRQALQQRVAAVIDDPDEVAALTETLRVFTNGIVLSVVEHPDEWPGKRQRAALDRLLIGLNLRGAVAG
jgi:AcrR family transcriptional regulator